MTLPPTASGVTVTCRVLGFSTQAFYKWRKRPVSRRDWDDAHLTNAALHVHRDDPAFGYRFIADELSEQGFTASENRVWRLCCAARIWSVFAKKRGRNRKAGPPVHDDLVQREFHASRPNQIWLTDITEHPTDEGKLYECAIKDVYSGKIVGYSIGPRMKASLAVAALRNAIIARNPPPGCIVHSDRGSQGGFNWSSQHLDYGGVGWDDRGSKHRRRLPVREGSGPRIERCGRRCAHRVDRSHRGQCSASSGA